MMSPISRLLVLAVLAISLVGCSYFQFPGVHKIPIQQGNIITQEMIDQLRPGMTRSQVRYVLGTPLIADTFNQDRWDYLFSLKMPSGKELRERVSVYFTNEKLSHFSGNYAPSQGALAADTSSRELEDETLLGDDLLESGPIAVPVPD